jgi:hypothetical protein
MQLMPAGAKYCDSCKTYSGWRWVFSGTLTTLAAVVAALVSTITLLVTQCSAYQHRNSETSIAFTRADQNVLYVVVSNTGLSRSTLRGAKLKFGAVDIQDKQLIHWSSNEGEPQSVIPAGGDMRVRLLVDGLQRRLSTDKRVRFTRDEVIAQLSSQVVMLEVDVQESNRHAIRTEAIAGSQLKLLVTNKLAGDTP